MQDDPPENAGSNQYAMRPRSIKGGHICPSLLRLTSPGPHLRSLRSRRLTFQLFWPQHLLLVQHPAAELPLHQAGDHLSLEVCAKTQPSVMQDVHSSAQARARTWAMRGQAHATETPSMRDMVRTSRRRCQLTADTQQQILATATRTGCTQICQQPGCDVDRRVGVEAVPLHGPEVSQPRCLRPALQTFQMSIAFSA